MSWWIHDVDRNHKVLFEGFKRPIWELFHKYIMFASFVVIKVNTRNLVIYFPQSDLIWNYLETILIFFQALEGVTPSYEYFQNYWLQILIFSSTRGCSLEGGRGGGSWLQMKQLQVKSYLINIIEYR